MMLGAPLRVALFLVLLEILQQASGKSFGRLQHARSSDVRAKRNRMMEFLKLLAGDHIKTRRGMGKSIHAKNEKKQVDECPAPVILQEESGTFSSPGYEIWENYPNNCETSWTLVVPDGKTIHLQFLAFDLEYEEACFFDWIDVFDGNDENAVWLGDYCGYNLPDDVIGTTNALHVTFYSDDSETYAGFEAKFYVHDDIGGEGESGSEPACGVPVIPPGTGRIVGGEEAVAHSWPWQVILLEFEDFLCGGSIVNKRWVITAAHCIRTHLMVVPGDLSVIVGAHNLNEPEEGEQVIDVAEFIVHEDYGNGAAYNNDVALLKLATDIDFSSDNVRPICLPGAEVETNMACIATGWGDTQDETEDSNILREVELHIVAHDTCKENYELAGKTITDAMICAGYPNGGGDTCQGDSGGPLVCPNNGVYFLQGITSWGVGCGEEIFPGVYAEVEKLVDWIQLKSGDAGQFR